MKLMNLEKYHQLVFLARKNTKEKLYTLIGQNFNWNETSNT